jgi:RNA polymerase sigma-70 factor (ECF subfamily)
LREEEKLARFEQAILPHLDAAYNLARWLTHNQQDAEDVVQEACLRAYQFLAGLHGPDGRAWLLTIVRNTCYTWRERHRAREPATSFDEEKHSGTARDPNPESRLLEAEERHLLRQALEALPAEYREVIVLRDLEGVSYKEIAGIAGIPLGTVMSRLARGRERLQQELARHTNQGA